MVCRDVKVTNCYFSIFSLLYKRFSLKNVEGSPQYGDTFSVISRFQKSWKKIMQKNLILNFFDISAFETEYINMSIKEGRKGE